MNKFQLTAIAALVGSAGSAMAADFNLGGGVDASINGTATAGTMIRTDAPNPAEYGLIPSSVVPGIAPGQLIGQTGGSDLNFAKDKPVSTVVKALVDVDVHGKNLGAFVRLAAWDDLTLGHQDAAYGNYPNGFTPNAPLSDKGFSADAKFSNAMFRDVYVYGNVDINDETKLNVRVGRQVLNWGVSQFFTGGIASAINPIDLAAQVRPGALPEESKVPVGMLSLSLSSGKTWGADAFLPYEFRAVSAPGCGTFLDTTSIVQPGCNFTAAVGAPIAGTPLSTIKSLTEQALLSSGYYVHRAPDATPSVRGDFGVSLRYSAASLHTDFRAYAMRTDNTFPNIYQVTVEDVSGATLPAGLAGGLGRLTNANGLKYSVDYPGGVHLFGLSFDAKPDPTSRVFGELAYRPNQPLGMSGTDMLTAFLLRAPTSLLQIQENILAVPAGGTFDGYTRFPVTTANLGVNKLIPKFLGANLVVLAAELGDSHVGGLSNTEVMHYGRALAYGAGPYIGSNGAVTACAETAPGLNGVPGKTCTSDGFISPNAWGVRGKISATYAGVLFGAALTPSLTVAKDVKGYSYDTTFSAGRLTLRTGLRADWDKRYFGEVAYTHFGDGKYNLLADRSNVTLVAGAKF